MIGVRTVALAALLLGCSGSDEPAPRQAERGQPAGSEEQGSVELSPSAETIYRRTLSRDGAPPCEALMAGVEAPAAALLEITEHVTQPPASGIRAATCLITEHATESEPTLIRWVSERASLGFGLLVLNHLRDLPPALRGRVIAAALAGEISDSARPRIDRYHAANPRESEPRGPLGD